MTLSWLETFDHIWLPASFTETTLLCLNGALIFKFESSSGHVSLALFLLWTIIGLVAVFRTVQFMLFFTGELFRDGLYFFMFGCRIISVLVVTALSMACWSEVRSISTVLIWVVLANLFWVVELLLGTQFLWYCREKIVMRAIDDLVFRDPIDSDTITRMKIFTERFRNLQSKIHGSFVQPRIGPISLPTTTERILQPSGGVGKAILDWDNDSSTHRTRKALWCVIDDMESTADLARDVYRLLSESRRDAGVALIDPPPPPSYRHQYALSTPMALEHEYRFPYCRPPENVRPWDIFLDSAALVQSMISQPLVRTERRLARIGPNAIEPQQKVSLVVHSVSNSVHAEELMGAIQAVDLYLPDAAKFLDIIIVSHSRFFLPVAEAHPEILDRVCALHVLESRTRAPMFICSSDVLAAPSLCERLFSLLLNGIYRAGGDHARQVMPRLSSLVPTPEADPIDDSSTESIFTALHAATENRAELLQLFAGITVIERFQIDAEIRQDSIKIARLLQTVSSSSSLESDVTNIPREHSIAVLNLTREVLDHGLPKNSVIVDRKAFSQCAHRLLTSLSASLQLPSDDPAITGIGVSDLHKM
ncbi:hypothetical protein MSAN_01118100 [Mycena sanguinolenta]|uniref:Transmembrane protein n=1 Tax=Mycena sanguinolenta TaxID=230812 RepID=A0A8H6YKV8_9AGAR|nr:hypothetical protein MSAN_01118100 [Mycena sanguinolenta]